MYGGIDRVKGRGVVRIGDQGSGECGECVGEDKGSGENMISGDWLFI